MDKHTVKMVNYEKEFGFTTNGTHFSLRGCSEEEPRLRPGDTIYGEARTKDRGPTIRFFWTEDAYRKKTEEDEKKAAAYRAERAREREIHKEFAHVAVRMTAIGDRIRKEVGYQYAPKWTILGYGLHAFDAYRARTGDEALYWVRYCDDGNKRHFDTDGLPDIDEEVAYARECEHHEREAHEAEPKIKDAFGYSRPFSLTSSHYMDSPHSIDVIQGGKVYVAYRRLREDCNQKAGFLIPQGDTEAIQVILDMADGDWETIMSNAAEKFRNDMASERVVILADVKRGGNYESSDGHLRAFPDKSWFTTIKRTMLIC